MNLETLRTFWEYSDWANEYLMAAARELPDDRLNSEFDIGRGSLRRTLVHIWAGEDVWLKRWQGKSETPWPDEDKLISIATLAESFRHTSAQRAMFVGSLKDSDLQRVQPYRDSLGGRFQATMGAMMIQAIVHSVHHRAQAVNLFRRTGAHAPELDYMMHMRKAT